MTDRERDAYIAENLMGFNLWDFAGDYEGEYPCFFVDDEGVNVYMTVSDEDSVEFNPSTDHAAAFAMEEKIKERGLDWAGDYIVELSEIIGFAWYEKNIPALVWDLFHATPAQRAQACYEMLKAREGK